MANKKFYFTDANREALDFGYGYPEREVDTPHGYAHLVHAPDEQTAYEYLAEYVGETVETLREQLKIHEYNQ